jgi:DNA-binding transcriptional regulator YdaS (Cro superfamily)
MEQLSKAIEIAGSQTALAKKLGISPQVVNNWLARRNVPAQYCPDIEQATGVRCEELRPDVNWAAVRATDCAKDCGCAAKAGAE